VSWQSDVCRNTVEGLAETEARIREHLSWVEWVAWLFSKPTAFRVNHFYLRRSEVQLADICACDNYNRVEIPNVEHSNDKSILWVIEYYAGGRDIESENARWNSRKMWLDVLFITDGFRRLAPSAFHNQAAEKGVGLIFRQNAWWIPGKFGSLKNRRPRFFRSLL
jgi:hypothetical protein